jgi:hypothetical protein
MDVTLIRLELLCAFLQQNPLEYLTVRKIQPHNLLFGVRIVRERLVVVRLADIPFAIAQGNEEAGRLNDKIEIVATETHEFREIMGIAARQPALVVVNPLISITVCPRGGVAEYPDFLGAILRLADKPAEPTVFRRPDGRDAIV